MTLSELYNLAENDSITVDGFDLGKREALSLMDEDGCCYIAIDPFKLSSAADEKTKLAHELGHCETGSFYNEYSPFDLRQRHEHKADKWAIEHILPREDIERAIQNGHTEPWQLADFFDVTENFIKKALCWYKHGTLDITSYFDN